MRPRLTAEELRLGRELREDMPSFMSTPTATAVTLLDLRILLANRALLRLLGRSRDEVLGRSAHDFLVPAERAEVDRQQREQGPAALDPAATSAAGTYDATFTVRRPDGGEIVLRTSTLVLRSATGDPIAMLTRVIPAPASGGPVHAVPSALEADDQRVLRAALAELPSFDDLPEPTVIVSAAGRLLCVNPAFTAAFGWSDAEVAGLPAGDVLAPHQRSWADERLRQITGAAVLPPPSAPVVRHRDGRAVESRGSSIPVRLPSGQVHYVVGTAVPLAPQQNEGSGGSRSARSRRLVG